MRSTPTRNINGHIGWGHASVSSAVALASTPKSTGFFFFITTRVTMIRMVDKMLEFQLVPLVAKSGQSMGSLKRLRKALRSCSGKDRGR